MTRAKEILQLNEIVSIGAASGIARAGISAARFKQKHDDKIRQAGHGDELDKAKSDRKAALKKRIKSPFNKTHRQNHLKAQIKVDDVREKGHAKFKKMMKGASTGVHSEVSQ